MVGTLVFLESMLARRVISIEKLLKRVLWGWGITLKGFNILDYYL